MTGHIVSDEARSDLVDIAQWSLDHWGEARGRAYMADLDKAFERVVTYPRLGKSLEMLRPGYRSARQGRHVIFYRLELGSVVIIRVLHDRMEFMRWLPG